MPDKRQWATDGFCFSATCVLQMGARHPDPYPSVLAFCQQQEPASAKERQKTIDASFAGDTAALGARITLWVRKHDSFAGKAVYIGRSQGPEFLGYREPVANGSAGAGFTAESRQIANKGHSWEKNPQLPEGLLSRTALASRA